LLTDEADGCNFTDEAATGGKAVAARSVAGQVSERQNVVAVAEFDLIVSDYGYW
jgi:hypothetical protein